MLLTGLLVTHSSVPLDAGRLLLFIKIYFRFKKGPLKKIKVSFILHVFHLKKNCNPNPKKEFRVEKNI